MAAGTASQLRRRAPSISCGASTVGSAASLSITRAAKPGERSRVSRIASPIRWYARQASRGSPSAPSVPISCAAARSSSSPSMSCEIVSFMLPLPSLVFRRAKQRSQLLGDRLAGAEDARAHRADRAIHRFCDVFVAHAFDLAHLDRRPQFLGQLFDRRVHRLRDLVGQQQALRRVDVAQLLALFKSFRLFRLYLRRGRRPPPHGHEVVLGRVDADPVQPRVKRAVATECGERPVGLDERFLRHIFDLGRVANEARKQTRQLALVFLDQQAVRLLVAALRPRYELPVDLAVRHRPLSRRRSPRAAPHPWTYSPSCNAYVPQTHALGNSSTPRRAVLSPGVARPPRQAPFPTAPTGAMRGTIRDPACRV